MRIPPTGVLDSVLLQQQLLPELFAALLTGSILPLDNVVAIRRAILGKHSRGPDYLEQSTVPHHVPGA